MVGPAAQRAVVKVLVQRGVCSERRACVLPTVLLVVFALKLAPYVRLIYLNRKPKERPDIFPEAVWPLDYVALAFVHSRRFGLLFLAGIGLDMLLRALV